LAKIKTELEPESINLDTIFNPNPELVKTYEDAKATYMWVDKDMRPEYVNEARIFAAARASKKPIKHNIFSLYRNRIGSKEYCYFFDLMVAKDYFQNNVDHTRLIGRWEKPLITRQYGINPATIKNDKQPEPTESEPSVESTETVYDYEFSKIRDQLVKWKETGIIGDKAIFYVVVDNRKYSMPYTWDQWLNLPMSDLELLGLHGKKYNALLTPGDPTALQLLRETIKQEIQKGLLNPPKT
jgi:hypothetical protein